MKLISIFLSLCIIYSTTFSKSYVYKQNDFNITAIEKLKLKYPNAKFIAVSIDEYIKYQKEGKIVKYSDKSLILLPDIETKKSPAYDNTPTTRVNASYSSSYSIFDSMRIDDSDDMYIILAVVGVFVVAVVIIDGVLILGDVVASNKKLEKWFEIGTTASYFSYTNEETKIKKYSAYGGLLISAGLKKQKSGIGFISEFGHLDLSLSEESTKDKKVYGAYAMVGPTFRHYFSGKTNFHIDIMAGKSDLKQVDIMGVARVGINFMVAKHGFLDFNFGMNYLGLKKVTDGYIDNDKISKNYNNIFGMSLGYSF